MRTLGVIPARGGSKRVSRKNVHEVGGKPLLLWTIEAARASTLDAVLVTTEDPEIAFIADEAGVTVIDRPADLADDHTPAARVVQHAMLAYGVLPDAVVMLQPTSPLRTAQTINRALELHTEHLRALCTVRLAEKSVPQLPGVSPLMESDGAIQIAHADAFLAKPDFWAHRPMRMPLPWWVGFDVDTERDLVVADALLRFRERDGES